MSGTTTTSETAAPASLLAGEESAPAEAPATDSTGATDTAAPKTDEQGAQASADGEAGAPTGEQEEGGDAGADASELKLEIPEGFEVDEAALKDLREIAREVGMKPEQAQKLIDMHVGAQKALIERADAAIAEQAKQMQAAVRADKEIGGAGFESSIKTAKQTLTRYGTPELVAALNESGLGNHPEMVRLLVRVGRASAEDSSAGKHTTAQATPATSEEANLRALYPTMYPQG